MINFEKLGKSRGICAVAINTETVDYVSIANLLLKQASKVLNLPYTIIELEKPQKLNQRTDIDSRQPVTWHNQQRYKLFELSPYDETLVIDADYLVLDNNLNHVFNLEWDYLLTRNCQSLGNEFPATMGMHSLPYVWATVFAFRKTKKSEQFFNLVKLIEDNYAYYHQLFRIRASDNIFRNDYAFAIADTVLNGYNIEKTGIKQPLINVNLPIKTMEYKNSQIVIKTEDRSFVLPVTNLHIMSKKFLQSDEFKYFINDIPA